MMPLLRFTGSLAIRAVVGVAALHLTTIGTTTILQAQSSEQERAKARAAQQQAAAARAAQQQAAAARAAQQQAAAARAAQQRAAQQAAAARAAQQQAAARAAQQQAAAARAAQQRAAQQRSAQEQARAAQQRAAQEQARAAQQRSAQEQARAAQQRAAQEQARAAQQRAAQEQARADQDRKRDGQERGRVPAGVAEGRGGAEGPSRRLQEVQRQRQDRREGDRTVIREPDRRFIVRNNNLASIRHDDNQRLARFARGTRSDRRGGVNLLSLPARNGSRVFSEVNAEGRALRRYRRMRDGREITLFDDRRFYGPGLVALSTPFVDLDPPEIDPREQYVIDYGAASEDDVYQALAGPPVVPLERSYALEEIRQGYQLRERMRSVELFDIIFDPGSWEIAPDQYPKLERLAHALNRILQERPNEVFLIEGHTDVLDSDIDNLTLSDRRAEAVAFILSQMYGVPAENLVTQGYGDRFLKVGSAKRNHRVSVRRITPLLRQEDGAVAFRQERGGLPLPPSGALQLSNDDRAFIVENVGAAAEPGLGIGGLAEGMRVPGGARLRSFPMVVRERIPALEDYRYLLAENQLAIVDPDSAQVVAILETSK